MISSEILSYPVFIFLMARIMIIGDDFPKKLKIIRFLARFCHSLWCLYFWWPESWWLLISYKALIIMKKGCLVWGWCEFDNNFKNCLIVLNQQFLPGAWCGQGWGAACALQDVCSPTGQHHDDEHIHGGDDDDDKIMMMIQDKLKFRWTFNSSGPEAEFLSLPAAQVDFIWKQAKSESGQN